MDLRKAAGYFDRQPFDTYDFGTSSWVSRAFKGQLKLADNFVSIYHRPTRKRMLYCTPANAPVASVVRCSDTLEVFMVGTAQQDAANASAYRSVIGLHRAEPATVYRKTPQDNEGVLGWAIEEVLEQTFADKELRTLNENQDQKLIAEGNYFMWLPSDSAVDRYDTVLLAGERYLVLEVYTDAGYRACRVTHRPDERRDIMFYKVGAPVYNPATQTNTPTRTPYQLTAKVMPVVREDRESGDLHRDEIKVMALESFMSFTPDINDEVTVDGRTYRVQEAEADSLTREWCIRAAL